MNFYVYGHFDDQGQLRYIGKGSKHRAKSLQGRSPAWKEIFPTGPARIEILQRYPDEESSLLGEIEMIAAAKQAGHPIVNFRAGGDGLRVSDVSPELRVYFSLLRSGENHWYYGKKREPHVSAALKAGHDKYIEEHGHPRLGAIMTDEHKAKFVASAHTPEATAKRAAKMRGRVQDPEHVEKKAAALRGRAHTPEHNAAISVGKTGKPNGLAGRVMPEEHRAKISAATMGRRALTAEEQARRMATWKAKGGSNKLAKAVICIETGTRYHNARVASEALGISDKHIQACCTGRRKTHGGFSWRYDEA